MEQIGVNIIYKPTDEDWLKAKNIALGTIGKKTTKKPDSTYKTKLLHSEHSPIRDLKFTWEWTNLPFWVSVHFVRHKIGVEHYISTSRPDRNKDIASQYKTRNDVPQGNPVNHIVTANAQAIMNISKLRLCNCASFETRFAWNLLLYNLKPYEPELVNLCVPTCIYRNGICHEYFPCGFNKTSEFKIRLEEYLKIFEV